MDGWSSFTISNSRSQRVLWLLEELGVPEVKALRTGRQNRHWPPSLLAIHPLGKSPVIVDGAVTLANPVRSSNM